jgi:hypothetical protein
MYRFHISCFLEVNSGCSPRALFRGLAACESESYAVDRLRRGAAQRSSSLQHSLLRPWEDSPITWGPLSEGYSLMSNTGTDAVSSHYLSRLRGFSARNQARAWPPDWQTPYDVVRDPGQFFDLDELVRNTQVVQCLECATFDILNRPLVQERGKFSGLSHWSVRRDILVFVCFPVSTCLQMDSI